MTIIASKKTVSVSVQQIQGFARIVGDAAGLVQPTGRRLVLAPGASR